MSEIELYDILTLEDGSEYTVLNILEQDSKKYYLLSPINEEEEPDFENLKIVQEIIDSGVKRLKEEVDEKILAKLSTKFLSLLEEELES